MRELDCVALLGDFPAEGLHAGDVGTIVHVYSDRSSCEVEFIDESGDTIGLLTLKPDQIRTVTSEEARRRRGAA